MNQGMSHLDNIWGCGGGNRPVMSLTNKVRTNNCHFSPSLLLGEKIHGVQSGRRVKENLGVK